MIELNVSHECDGISPEEAVAVYNDISDGFVFYLQDIIFKRESLNDIIKDIEAKFGKIECHDYSIAAHSQYSKYKSDNIRFYVRGDSLDCIGTICAKTESDLNKLFKIYKLHSDEENDEVEIYMTSYSMSGGRLIDNSHVIKKEELEFINELYYPYINTDVLFEQFFVGAENILLMVGLPGLGKSKFSSLALKHALHNPDKLPYDKMLINKNLSKQYVDVVQVKSIEVLSNDGFWRTLEKDKPDIVIIDDLDYMLTRRDAEIQSSEDAVKNAFLNQFLSFTDGVEKNNTKFIITTNQSYADIDSALLRKGRLFDILELRKLKSEEALAIWVDAGLSENKFNQLFKGDVLAAELGSEINKLINTKITTVGKSYLKEDNISKTKKASAKKVISL